MELTIIALLISREALNIIHLDTQGPEHCILHAGDASWFFVPRQQFMKQARYLYGRTRV